MLKFYRENARPEDYLEIEGYDFATMDIDAYVNDLFNHSFLASEQSMKNAEIKTRADFINDPAVTLYNAVTTVFLKLRSSLLKSNAAINAGSKTFAAGLLEWEKGQPSYPDANFTIRLTYGNVKPYDPKDGVHYNYYTTTKGILEKAKIEYKKERTALSNKVLESYNIHVGDEIIYNNRKYKVHSAIINSKNVIYVILAPIGFKYFNEKIPIERLV